MNDRGKENLGQNPDRLKPKTVNPIVRRRLLQLGFLGALGSAFTGAIVGRNMLNDIFNPPPKPQPPDLTGTDITKLFPGDPYGSIADKKGFLPTVSGGGQEQKPPTAEQQPPPTPAFAIIQPTMSAEIDK